MNLELNARIQGQNGNYINYEVGEEEEEASHVDPKCGCLVYQSFQYNSEHNSDIEEENWLDEIDANNQGMLIEETIHEQRRPTLFKNHINKGNTQTSITGASLGKMIKPATIEKSLRDFFHK